MKYNHACKLACNNSNKRIIAPVTKRLLMVLFGIDGGPVYDCIYPENGRLASIPLVEFDSDKWVVFDVKTKKEVS